MQNKITAWKGKLECENVVVPSHPLISATDFIYLLSCSLEHNPTIYMSADNTLWVYYARSCFVCSEFLESYGLEMALSKISVYGGADGFEGGELVAELSADKKHLLCEKRNVSGQNFSMIHDIALKISAETKAMAEEYQNLLSTIDYKNNLTATERTAFMEHIFSGYLQENIDTYYRYIFFKESGKHYLDSLTINQRKKLWTLYLENGLSPLEFDDAFMAMEESNISAFPWELALRLALEEKEISVSYENGFSISDRDGNRIYPSFESTNSAEKLFIKLIFPRQVAKGKGRV